MMRKSLLVATTLLIVSVFVHGYIPGIPQHNYNEHDPIEIKTRKLSSIHNVPYDFYSLKYCQPQPLESAAENFGEFMFGDRIENSVFDMNFNEEIKCRKIGSNMPNTQCFELTDQDVKDFIEKISDEYNAQLIVDSLPVANRQDPDNCGNLPSEYDDATTEEDNRGNVQKYARPDGFPVGCTSGSEDDKKYYINNHLSFNIKYHPAGDDKYYIVGAEVIPSSIDWTGQTCAENVPLPTSVTTLELKPGVTKNIEWSYSVKFTESDIKWASRWDAYIHSDSNNDDYKIHWFSIINSLMIVLFLTGMVAMILLRILHKDIVQYNRIPGDDEEDPTLTDETGWKLLHGDVFRAPHGATFLSILTGSGVQLFVMAIVTLVLAFLGFLSPANRGSLGTAMIFLFVFSGVFCGYWTLRLYKMFDIGRSWQRMALASAIYMPGTIFSAYALLNLIMLIGPHSSIAAPFGTVFKVMALWFLVSVPLVFIGAYFGFKKQAIEHPTAVHKLPRQITQSPTFLKPWVSILLGGILPFGAVFIELYFIMSSVWLQKFYYVFGFLFLVFNILILTCAEITIVLTYFQLCNEDYRWWWRSYLSAGSSALYLFLYSAFYYQTSLQINNASMSILYFGYMAIASYVFFLLTGTIGFLASLLFVRKIYSSIKVA